MTKVFQRHPWLSWLLPLFLMILVFNAKAYLAIFLGFFSVLFLFGIDLYQSLYYTLLLSIPFERVIRSWLITVVPLGPEAWQPGYDYYFGFSIKLIVAIALFLLIVLRKKPGKINWKINNINWVLVIFFASSGLSTLLAFRFDLAITGFFRLWLAIWLFFISRQFLSQPETRNNFFTFLISSLLLFGVVGSLQFINRQPLGLDMEDISRQAPFGFLTTDEDEIYRVSGFMGHPTYFGSFLSLLLPVAVGMFFQETTESSGLSKAALISGIAIVVGFIAVVGTFSRSAWLVVVMITLAFAIKARKLTHKQAIKRKKPLMVIGAGIALVTVVYGSLILARAGSLRYVWKLGSGRGRLILIRQSLTMMKNNPIFGAGINHFTHEMMNQGVSEEHRGFIYPVHNTFLLFFSELGIPAGLAFATFVGVLIINLRKKVIDNWLNFGVWVGAITFLINSQFHALFNRDPSFDMFMVMMGYLATLL